MQIKGKYSWVKHLDFMLIDLLCLLISYFIAFYSKFGTLSIRSEWSRYVVIISLVHLADLLCIQDRRGVFPRGVYHHLCIVFLPDRCHEVSVEEAACFRENPAPEYKKGFPVSDL